MRPAPHRVRRKLQHREQPSFAGLARAQRIDGGFDGGRMVGEVVVERDPVHRRAVLQPPPDPGEAAERTRRRGRLDARVPRRRDGGQRVGDVVRAALSPLDLGDGPATMTHLEPAPVRRRRDRRPVGAVADPFHRGPAPHREDLLEVALPGPGHDPAAGGHDAHHVVELALHVGEVAEDVGVVELQVVQHERARAVVQELRALVEEGGVVLVGLDDEQPPRAAPADAGDGVEVARHAADEEARVESGGVQDHRDHRGGGGLAVGAGHRDDVPAGEHVRRQPGGAGRVRQPRLEDVLHARVAAGHRVADHHRVGRGVELRGVVPGDRIDAGPGQHPAHRRVDVLVRAGDPVPELARDQGQTGHERAADAEEVDVHGREATPRSGTGCSGPGSRPSRTRSR